MLYYLRARFKGSIHHLYTPVTLVFSHVDNLDFFPLGLKHLAVVCATVQRNRGQWNFVCGLHSTEKFNDNMTFQR